MAAIQTAENHKQYMRLDLKVIYISFNKNLLIKFASNRGNQIEDIDNHPNQQIIKSCAVNRSFFHQVKKKINRK